MWQQHLNCSSIPSGDCAVESSHYCGVLSIETRGLRILVLHFTEYDDQSLRATDRQVENCLAILSFNETKTLLGDCFAIFGSCYRW